MDRTTFENGCTAAVISHVQDCEPVTNAGALVVGRYGPNNVKAAPFFKAAEARGAIRFAARVGWIANYADPRPSARPAIQAETARRAEGFRVRFAG